MTEPVKAEALDQDVRFTYDNVEYVIEREAVEDTDLWEMLQEDDKQLIAVRGFLGTAQWQAFKDSHRDANGRVSLTRHTAPFIDVMMVAIAGKAGGSSGAS